MEITKDICVIENNDPVSLISRKFGLSVDIVKELNSNQLKYSDFYSLTKEAVEAGNAGEAEKRIPLPGEPEERACGNEICSEKTADFVDILYVPAHPSNGNPYWYAITQKAQDAIKKEQDLLSKSVSKDSKATLSKMNELGLLSKFQTAPHEAFLESANDKERYRDVLRKLVALRSGAAEYAKNGEAGYVIYIAEEEGLDYDSFLDRSITWENVKQYFLKALPYISPPVGQILDWIAEDEKKISLIEKARWRVQAKLVDHLEDEIDRLEYLAERSAKTKKSDDGTAFVYDTNLKYFTSERQKDIAARVKQLFRGRPYKDQDMSLNSHATALIKYKKFWNEDAKETADFIFSETPITRGMPQKVRAYHSFIKSLNKLNIYGYLIKEQILTKDELFGGSGTQFGPNFLNNSSYYKHYRENAWFSDKAVPIEIENEQHVREALTQELGLQSLRGVDSQVRSNLIEEKSKQVNWSYYPTLAVIETIDATLAEWLGDLRSVLANQGGSTASTIPDIFSEFVWVKAIAKARLENLKNMAKERAGKEGCELSNHYLDRMNRDTVPKTFQVLWDETKFVASRKSIGLFRTDSGAADLQVVECSLLSDGNVYWVRGPSWFIPSSQSEIARAKGHVKDVTEKVGLVDPILAPELTLGDALKAIKNGALSSLSGPKLNLKLEIDKFESKAFWQDSYHWQGGMHEEKSAYIANAQAQFFRFTSSTEATLNLPTTQVTGVNVNRDLTGGASIGMRLNLLSGQLHFATWFPLNNNAKQPAKDVEGIRLSIPYIAKLPKQDAVEERIFDGGELFMKVSATVYGTIGASCNLSAQLSYGPSTTEQGNIGVRGQAFNVASYNEQVNAHASARVHDTNMKIPKGVAQAAAKVDLFAGVEAGGKINADVYWRPPTVTISGVAHKGSTLKLGSVGTQLAGNYGIGFSGEFRLVLDNGVLTIIAAAKVVCGPGVSGKFSFALNAINADRFIAHLLSILKESGFRYIRFFGEKDEHGKNEAFEELNQQLTLAVCLGLTLGEVLLLPATSYNSYKFDILQEDYAPTIARHILDKSQKGTQAWVKNLPPETLSNLFSCLINAKEKGWFESVEEEKKRFLEKLNMAKALAQLFDWIKPSVPNKENNHKVCRQLEEALIRMDSNLEENEAPLLQWKKLADSWQRIDRFISPIEVEKNILNDEGENVIIVAEEDAKFIKKNMANAMKVIGSGFSLFRYVDANGNIHYRAVKKSTEDGKQSVKEKSNTLRSIYREDKSWEEIT
ncbi:hypothetical protein Q8W40_18205 [Vibrio penaeicida]|uniref:hypothetical protein n=1 Tax=Vibrio penaeicida TaxID=104609 RepID=UPI0027332CFA|nr:hypothetical protein [Vibrio penaeicida]MDP2574133.1 hypothetical protein [Vibrio penaeicida]